MIGSGSQRGQSIEFLCSWLALHGFCIFVKLTNYPFVTTYDPANVTMKHNKTPDPKLEME